MFLTLALDGGERSTSCPRHATPEKRALSTHFTESWAGPTASLDVVGEGKKRLRTEPQSSSP